MAHLSLILLTRYDSSSTKTPSLPSISQCHYCNIPCHASLCVSVPEAVRLVNTTVQSDSRLVTSWRESPQPNGPKESVRYQLAISHLARVPETPLRQSDYPHGRLALLVTGLSGGKRYELKVQRGYWVLSLPFSSSRFCKG